MTDQPTSPTPPEATEVAPPAPHGHEHSERESFLRLLVVILAGLFAAALTHTTSTVLVVVAVIVMIMIHELGHFATAKWSGMKVTEYFLGFGPKIWSVKRGETEYGIKAIPAGGYVKIIGMSNLEPVEEGDEPRTYRQQPYWQRIMVASAGSFMHFVMAFLILVSLYGIFGLADTSSSPTIGELPHAANGAQTPALAAGLKLGDKVLAINGTSVSSWSDVIAAIGKSSNHALAFTIQRNGQTMNLTAQVGEPVALSDGSKVSLGVGPQTLYRTVGPLKAVTTAGSEMWHSSGQVVNVLQSRFSPSGITDWAHQVADAPQAKSTTAPSAAQTTEDNNRLVSPVGLVNYASDAAHAGIRPVLALLFSMNLFIGIFNLIPLLPFDGGHIAVATYERIRSRKNRRYMVDFAKLLPVSYGVLLILVVMGLSAVWLDVLNPLSNPFK